MDGPFDLSGPEDNLATGAFDVSSIMNPPQNSAQKAKSNADDLSSAYKAVAALKAVEPKSQEELKREQWDNPYIEGPWNRKLKSTEQRAMEDIMKRGFKDVSGFQAGVLMPSFHQEISNSLSEYQNTLKEMLGIPRAVTYGPAIGSPWESIGGIPKRLKEDEIAPLQSHSSNIAPYGQKPYTKQDLVDGEEPQY